MTMEEIFTKVRGVVAEVLNVGEDRVTPDARFVEDLDASQLDQMELLVQFEAMFDGTISEEEAEKLTTVGAVVEYLCTKL